MALQELLVDTLISHLPPLKQTPSGWKKTNCPMCIRRNHSQDKRERFGLLLTPTSIGMNCFNCGFSALWMPGAELSNSIKELLAALGVSEQDIDKLYFQSYLEKTNIILPDYAPLQEISSWAESQLPPESHTISEWANLGCTDNDFLEVAEYALNRKIYDLSKVYWSPSKPNKMKNRLIVPFYHRNKIVGFTSRLVGHHNVKTRYYHEIPDKYIYNLDAQRTYERKYTIIVEGAFDALLCDGLASLRNGINNAQAQMINNIHTYKVVVPDRDKSGFPLVQCALDYGWYVSFPPWGRGIKDLTDAAQKYGLVYAVRSVLFNITNDPDKIKVWRRIDEGKY